MEKSFLIIFLFMSMICFGQQAQVEKQIDIVLTNNLTKEKVISMGKFGFVIQSQQKIGQRGMKTSKYLRYNTDLEFVSEKELSLESHLNLKDFIVEDSILYLAFTHNGGGIFTIAKYDVLKDEIKEFTGEFPKGTQVKDFKILNGLFYFVCSVSEKYNMTIVNLERQEITIQSLNFEDILPRVRSISNFQVMENTDELTLSVDFRESAREIKTHFVILNEKAEITSHYDLTQSEGKYIMSSNAIKTGDKSYIITGDYSLSESLIVSNGLFITVINAGNIEKSNFYNFTELKNFFTSVSERFQTRIEQRKERAAENGREYSVSYLAITHDISKIDEDYFFLIELYYPLMAISSSTTSTMSTASQNGLQYTHAYLMRFDKEANIVWDQSIRMDYTLSSNYAKKIMNVSKTSQGNYCLVFNDVDGLKSKTIDKNGNTIEELSSVINETTEGRKNTTDADESLNYWYDSYFLQSGYFMKNINENERILRRVFSVNKIRL